jgi:hypothetical protein
MKKMQMWKAKGTYSSAKVDDLGTGFFYFAAEDYQDAVERALVVCLEKGGKGAKDPSIEHLEQRGDIWV